jgi:hypothetical protein
MAAAPTERPLIGRLKRFRGWTLGVFAAVLVAVLSTWISGAGESVYHDVFSAKSALAATEVRYFRTNELPTQSLVRVAGHASGECLENYSAADQGAVPNAHRCFAPRRGYDPCFNYDFSELECVTAPWATTSVRFKVIQFLPLSTAPRVADRRSGAPTAPPWALELANGQRCVFQTGAGGMLVGLRLSYVCQHGIAFGEPDRSGKLWLIPYKSPTTVGTVTTAVRTAWY